MQLAFSTRLACRRTPGRTALALLAALTACCLATGCAVEAEAPAEPGYGTLHLALTGAFPGAARMTVKIFEGAVTDLGRPARYQPAVCAPYLEGDGTPRNKLTISKLKTRKDYALLLELYADAECKQLTWRAYRGGVAVDDGVGPSSNARPYYVQPYEIGKFTGLAQVNNDLVALAQQRSCSSDLDCRSLHPNATCTLKTNTCTVDHLFPLNGGDRRAFPLVLPLGDGRVTVAGGFNAAITGLWAATSDRVELFDPTVGIFQAEVVSNAGAPVGLAQGVTLGGPALAIAAGTTSAKVSFQPGASLQTAVETKGCTGGAVSCPVSKQVTRWDLLQAVAQQFAQVAPVAFPLVATVRTADGDRVLVAGGATVPLPANKKDDSRKGATLLCQMDGGAIACSQGPTMQAGRARGVTACVQTGDGGCKKVLVLGGRQKPTSPLAEVYDATSNQFVPVALKGTVPALLHGGELLPLGASSFVLVGASAKALFLEDDNVATGADLAPLKIDVDVAAAEPTVTFSAIDLGSFAGSDGGKRMLASGVALADGSVLVIGGLDDKLQAATEALWIGADGKGKARLALGIKRFGTGAARIGGKGPLGDCVLVAGGFAVEAGGLQPQNHVEVFCPPAP